MTTGTGAHAYAGPVTMLYSWLRRHPKVLDGAQAAVLAFLGVASAAVMIFLPGSSAVGLTRVVGIPLALLLAVPVIFRRSQPVGAFAAAVVIGGIQVLLDVRPNATDLVIVILLYTLAAYTPRRISVTGLTICLVGSAGAGGPGVAGPPRAAGAGTVRPVQFARAPPIAGGV